MRRYALYRVPILVYFGLSDASQQNERKGDDRLGKIFMKQSHQGSVNLEQLDRWCSDKLKKNDLIWPNNGCGSEVVIFQLKAGRLRSLFPPGDAGVSLGKTRNPKLLPKKLQSANGAWTCVSVFVPDGQAGLAAAIRVRMCVDDG